MAVQSHIQAAEALTLTSPLAGQAYFITNQEPIQFWDMLGNVCHGLGYPRPSVHLPFVLIMFLAMVFEYIVRPLVGSFVQVRRQAHGAWVLERDACRLVVVHMPVVFATGTCDT